MTAKQDTTIPPCWCGTGVRGEHKNGAVGHSHAEYTAYVTVIRFNADGEPVQEWMEEGTQSESVSSAVKSAADKVVANITGNASWSYVHGQGTQERERT